MRQCKKNRERKKRVTLLRRESVWRMVKWLKKNEKGEGVFIEKRMDLEKWWALGEVMGLRKYGIALAYGNPKIMACCMEKEIVDWMREDCPWCSQPEKMARKQLNLTIHADSGSGGLVMGKYAIGLGRPCTSPPHLTTIWSTRQQPLGRSASTSINNHSVDSHRPLYTPSITTRSVRIDHSTCQQPLGRSASTTLRFVNNHLVGILPPYVRLTTTLRVIYCHPTGNLLGS